MLILHRLLLDYGANPTLKNKKGATAAEVGSSAINGGAAQRLVRVHLNNLELRALLTTKKDKTTVADLAPFKEIDPNVAFTTGADRDSLLSVAIQGNCPPDVVRHIVVAWKGRILQRAVTVTGLLPSPFAVAARCSRLDLLPAMLSTLTLDELAWAVNSTCTRGLEGGVGAGWGGVGWGGARPGGVGGGWEASAVGWRWPTAHCSSTIPSSTPSPTPLAPSLCSLASVFTNLAGTGAAAELRTELNDRFWNAILACDLAAIRTALNLGTPCPPAHPPFP